MILIITIESQRFTAEKIFSPFDHAVDYLVESGLETVDLDRPNGIIRMKGYFYSYETTMEQKDRPRDPSKYIVVSANDTPIGMMQGVCVVLVRPKEKGSIVGARLVVSKFDASTQLRIYSQAATLGNYERRLVDLMVTK